MDDGKTFSRNDAKQEKSEQTIQHVLLLRDGCGMSPTTNKNHTTLFDLVLADRGCPSRVGRASIRPTASHRLQVNEV